MAEERKASSLEAIADTFERVDKYVGVIAAIIAALTFSQGNRIVSYAFVIIGYALIASFLWRVMTQKSVVRRVIATVRPLPEKQRYVYPQSQRWVAGITLVVLTLFSFGWVGVNGWRDYQAREGLLFPRAKENELLVIIARFDNRSTKGIDPTQRIQDRLRQEFKEAGITNVHLEPRKIDEPGITITNLDEAREIGERHGAIFVIWGWFDDLGFTPNFTIVREKEFALKGMELEEVSVEPPKDFSLYIREGLPAQMAYFSTLTIGQVYFWDEKFEEALSVFDIVIENAQEGGTSEGLANVYFYRGYIHQVPLDDPQAAIADYDRAIELKPDYVETYIYRGAIYYNKGDYDPAIADFDRAIELKPDYVETYIYRGLAYGHKGEYDLAIADFDRAIELRPEYADAYHKRGTAYCYKGEYDLAVADFDRAIELEPDCTETYNNRGLAHTHRGEYDQAITDYDRAIELKPDYADAYHNRGLAYAHKCKLDQAIADFSKAIELKPDYAGAHYNRGAIYYGRGEYDLAIAEYDRVIELRPDYAEAYNNRGNAYTDKGDYGRAIADYDKAIELNPDFADACNNRGIAYVDKGEYDLAIADYDKAIELRPDLAEAYYNRGVAHKKKGEKEEAIRDFERFLELSEDEYCRNEAEVQLRELRGQ